LPAPIDPLPAPLDPSPAPIDTAPAHPTPPAAAPAPNPKATPPSGQPAVRHEPARSAPAQVSEPSDGPVLERAQSNMFDVDERLDDDPYFAELRRAINDDTPLGPREEDWPQGAADDIVPGPGHDS
jgi:hypothetical protein